MAEKRPDATKFPHECRMTSTPPAAQEALAVGHGTAALVAAAQGAAKPLASYIPAPNDPLKIICVNFHIFQDDNGGQNYQANEKPRLRQILAWVNARYAQPAAPNRPPSPAAPLLADTRIRFKLHRVEYYRDSALFELNNRAQLQAVAVARDPSILKQLNVYVVHTAGLGGGNTVYPTAVMTLDSWVMYVLPYAPQSDPNWPNVDWGFSVLLGHEFGHCLDLRHTYDGGSNCNAADPDFLSDVFGTAPNSCPHDAGWSANFSLWPPKSTNNMMGGTRDSSWISRLQAARMHRALTEKSVRRYVATGCGDCASCVAFSVRGENHSSAGPPVKLSYTGVDLNETWGWNGSDFVAPVGGIYHFDMCILREGRGDGVDVLIRKNANVDLVQVFPSQGPNFGVGSVSFNTRLEQGDVVSTLVEGSASPRTLRGFLFSGHLICGCG